MKLEKSPILNKNIVWVCWPSVMLIAQLYRMQKNLSSDQVDKGESDLNYLDKKLLHMIELQIMDLENNLRYIQKKHAMSQMKESLSQIYNIFNQTEPLYKDLKALFLHEIIKKLMNLFGIIYFTIMEHINQNIKNSTIRQGVIANNINDEEPKQKESKQKKKDYKLAQTTLQIEDSLLHKKCNKLGGIYLYNESYTRHIYSNRIIKSLKREQKHQMSKQELRLQVLNELNTSPYDTPRPDQNLDLFAFKFKYGREDPAATFHDELQSISDFFRESQNQAFQFLNKTKDQNALMCYDEDSFHGTMSLIKAEKEQKIRKFTQKIQSAFQSIKQKTQTSMTIFENTLNQVQKLKQCKPPCVFYEKQAQTDFNIEQELQVFRRKLAEAEERYEIMLELKKREVEESLSAGIELQNSLGTKNRQIVYLKLKIEEDALLISSLNKKIKFIKGNRISIDRNSISTKQNYETKKIQPNLEIKEPIKQEIKSSSEEVSFEQIRKQKKMAKLKMINRRRGSLMEDKVLFTKRFTQAEGFPKSISGEGLQKWNLSQIAQNYRQESSFNDSQSSSSSQKEKKQRKSRDQKLRNSLQQKSSRRSRHSIADYQRSRKLIKDKGQTNSQMVENIHRQSFLNKINLNIRSDPSSPRRFSYASSSEDQSNRQQQLKITAEQMSKIEKVINKQTNSVKEDIFRRSETKKKSIFAQQRNVSNQNTLQEPVTDNCQKQLLPQVITQEKGKTKEAVRPSILKKIGKDSFLKQGQKKIGVNQKISMIKKNNVIEQNEIKITQKSLKVPSQQVAIPPIQEIKKKIDPANIVAKKIILASNQYNITIHPCLRNIIDKIVPAAIEFPAIKTESQEETFYTNLKGPDLLKYNKQNCNEQLEKTIPQESKSNSQMIRSAGNSIIFSSKATNSFYMERNKENKSEARLRSIKHSAYNSKQSEQINQNSDKVKKQKREQPIFISRNNSIEINKKHNKTREENQIQQQNYRTSLMDESHASEDSQRIKQRLAILQTEEREAKSLAMNCRTLQQFKNRITKIHLKKCGNNCTHLQKFVNNYLKLRQNSKQKVRLHISNIHDNIEEKTDQFPTLSRKKN